ncbi:MAG: glycosyltransferase family 1 protein [Candidatus Kerfeldbacteria bacterium CG15_BIG_FIL_POST_REV_8_21_14_020_45_12]|uniref:Glycosyltransferase family 1 protein n=1 Tax=Candidatus Kerfeldbacteria bacterium CG15_BIG_FIL_POST_REV_8_21_14_020_45_12 TaxID=2014247 RepID=A0A2M7H254_9BACT|nr:MAG: glycosyltransferase family 1 protein [Candidatus Kerfeldbacteria bacterium CG15_BIG_FIL_POST_REV_8_21_14_020_45_12]PJA92978.1 MAG: glycosyltransferase family 1 protein [Candidatus Kerfeldbacteria bacterium CG_4_9_14_3_um_filter_45_8]
MRIGVDCRSLQEPQSAGVSVYTKQLLRAMLDLPESQEHQFVFFVNASGLGKNQEVLEIIQHGLESPLVEWRIHSVPNKLITTLQVLESRPGFNWMFGEVDVVFFPNIHFLPLVKQKIPYVLTMHDLSFERYPECFSAKGRLWHRLIKPAVLTKLADKVIAVSEHTRRDLIDLYYISPNKIEVVYPGLPKAAPAVFIDTPEQYILSLATLEPRKNLEALIEAFDLLRDDYPNLKLVLVGGGGWKSTAIQSRVANDPRIEYRGYVDEPTKQALLTAANAFVYPSLYEGFGFPPLEAQACGVPVIVGAHSSLPEVVGDSALLVDVLDASSIARSIKHVISDEPLRTELIKKGYENVRRYQWQQSAEKTLAAIKSVVQT